MSLSLPRLPTRAADWRLVARTVRLVLGIPTYAVVAVAAWALALTAFVVPGNWALVRDLVVGGPLSLEGRLRVLADLYPVVGSGFTVAQTVVLLLTAVLVGVNVALLGYHLREHRVSVEGSTGGLAGTVLGTLGTGCAACGSAVVAGILGTGAAGALTVLPLEGLEFALLAIPVVLVSVFWLADGMRGGEIRGCPVDV